jgi:hypothetical protein
MIRINPRHLGLRGLVVIPGQVWRLDEISQGPKRDFRLPPGRWLVLAAIGGLVTVIAAVLVLANAGGHHAIHSPRVLAAPSSSQTSAPGGAGRSLDLGVPPAALADLHGIKSQETGIAGWVRP